MVHRFLILGILTTAMTAACDISAAIPVVQRVLHRPLRGVVSFEVQAVQHLGDRVSVAILRTIDLNSLRDPDMASRIISLISAAFSEPSVVESDHDRIPSVALLLLDSIERQSVTPDVSEQAHALAKRLEIIKPRTER